MPPCKVAAAAASGSTGVTTTLSPTAMRRLFAAARVRAEISWIRFCSCRARISASAFSTWTSPKRGTLASASSGWRARVGALDRVAPDVERPLGRVLDALAKRRLADRRSVVLARLAGEAGEVLHQRLEAAVGETVDLRRERRRAATSARASRRPATRGSARSPGRRATPRRRPRRRCRRASGRPTSASAASARMKARSARATDMVAPGAKSIA